MIGFEFCVLDRPLFQFHQPALPFSPPELFDLAQRAAYRFSRVDETKLPSPFPEPRRMIV